ncbi:MAG: hypothetical protein FWD75_05235 [Propionibacteriaceae bacterium]|nr:hypothetical protein [Propionibacteriaceae bacterium]
MARMMSTTESRERGLVVALSVADTVSMDTPLRALSPHDRDLVTRASMDTWGLCGVGVRRGEDWIGVVLITPDHALPRGHPLSGAGLDPHTAGLALLHIDATAPMGTSKRLCVGLTRRLRGAVTGVEAQSSLMPSTMSTLAPSRAWLTGVGFQPLRYPPNRYRLDFATLATWIRKHLVWESRPAIAVSPRPAPAGRAVHRG